MEEYNINELMLFIVGVVSAVGGLLLIIQRSKCEEINCLCFKCKRNVKAVIDSEKMRLGMKLPTTPKPKVNEPEPEASI